MNWLIVFLLHALSLTNAMLARLSSRHRASMSSRHCSSTALGQHDPIAAAMHSLGPCMKQLESPIDRGIALSSWYNDRVEGYPEYLLTYSKYFKPMQALHCINLVAMQRALVDSHPKALGDWAAICSANDVAMGMPEAGSKLLRVLYLDLLVTANKFSPEQKNALALVIDTRIPHLHACHLAEMETKFIEEFYAVPVDSRAKILTASSADFLLAILNVGMQRAIALIRKHVPTIDDVLLNEALRLWKLAHKRTLRAGTPSYELVPETYTDYTILVAASNLGSAEKEALVSAAWFLSSYMTFTQEILQFVRQTDRTVNNELKAKLSALLPLDE